MYKMHFIEEHQGTLEGFFQRYHSYKNYVNAISTKEKSSAYYEHRKTIVDAIDRLYPTLDDDYKKIIEMRHWNKYGQYSWKEIGEEIYVTANKAKLMNDRLMRLFAEQIGWL